MNRREVLAAAVGAVACGCGYSLQGRGITTDSSVKRIGVPLFKDRSGKLGLDTRVTQAVMEELLKRGRFTVVREITNVDAVVEGDILSCTVAPVKTMVGVPSLMGSSPVVSALAAARTRFWMQV